MSRTPTLEQQACVTAITSAIRILKIEACAGSGKTSTLVMMAEALDLPSLYLAFNKVTAEEAALKFPQHVTCRTTHSIAYAAFGSKLKDKLKRPPGKYQNCGWTGTEIGKLYEIESYETRTGETITASHFGLLVRDTVARFEQSADMVIEDKHVPKGDLKEKLHDNVGNIAYCVDKILPLARRLWEDRINTKSVVQASHDTYLKLYQLSKPVLKGYDVLYVDEFQDTTPCVLDIVMNQAPHMQVVMVGDSRQAIYGWRGAVNAMARVEAEERKLTKSFRYGQAIADIATAVLECAMVITGNETIESRCARFDLVDRTKSYTRLFRTNGALLSAAVPEILNGTKVALEIDVKDFVKLLFSAFSLAQGIKKDVKHDKVVPYLDWEELKADGTKNDPELKRIVKIVEDGKALEWIDILENFSNAARPLVTFTTAHKSKGREWFQVIVEDDFKSGYNEEGEWIGLPTEEQNLLYVACTRAINVLEYNETVKGYLREGAKAHSTGFAVRKLMADLRREGPKDGCALLEEEEELWN
jgi:hypothetical protein